jgi:hypothetical protein
VASIPFTDEDKARVLAQYSRLLPWWFEPTPGFLFRYDNSPAVVVGWGAWRDWDFVGGVNVSVGGKTDYHLIATYRVRKATLIFTYLYKGEWHMSDIDKMFDGCSPERGNMPALAKGHSDGH